MRSVMQHQFSKVPTADIQRSSFNRSHGRKSTFDAGYLVPILVDEALPGDTFNCKMTAFARMATPIYPIMDNLYMDTFFFAVPYRLVWDNWEKFNGAQDDPGDSIDFTVPTLSTITGIGVNTLADYMGIPIDVASLDVNSLHFRAYNLIWNEWFRDQNLQDSLVVDKDDGPDDITDYVLKRRGKRHDYFTSCLPFPQKGDSIDIPIGTSAPIDYVSGATDSSAMIIRDATTDGADNGGTDTLQSNASGQFQSASAAGLVILDPNGRLVADLSAATAATVNQLRQAFQIQKLLERDARGGTRYIEVIKSHFNVTSPDYRLQRPEYLGGGSTPININPVAQTSSTDATTPQGNLSAFGTASVQNNGFTKSFTEHCLILGLVSVRADLTYQQGLDKMWTRQTRYDYYWPALAHIGEQAVLEQEIYADSGTPEAVFGYQERYAEYRFKNSQITGTLRSDAASSLDAWHLSQDFTATPTLGDTFIQDTPPMDRVLAVPAEPDFIFDSYFNYRCARPMPMFGTPGLIDHF